jgi:hypothetical protein
MVLDNDSLLEEMPFTIIKIERSMKYTLWCIEKNLVAAGKVVLRGEVTE